MQVVAVVHHWVDALRAALLDVRAIDFRGFLVGLDGGFIVAGADVDVCGHVHNVSGIRRECGQPVRAS